MKQSASEVTDAQRRTCKTCKNMYIYYTLDFTSSDEWKVSVQDVHIQQQYTDICLISTYPRNDSNIKKNRQVSFFFLKYISCISDKVFLPVDMCTYKYKISWIRDTAFRVADLYTSKPFFEYRAHLSMLLICALLNMITYRTPPSLVAY